MSSLLDKVKAFINSLPRISFVRANQRPAVNVYRETYWHGSLAWAVLPLFVLAFWISLYVAYCCICRWQLLWKREVIDSTRIRSHRKVIGIITVGLHVISSCVLVVFVYGSEQLHHSFTDLQSILEGLNTNLTVLNATVGQVRGLLAAQTAMLATSGQSSESIGRTITMIESSDLLRSMQDLSTLVAWSVQNLNKLEFIRWISVVAFTCKFCLLTLLMCKCCQLSRTWKFSWSSLGMVVQSISSFALLAFFNVPIIMVCSDYCTHPKDSLLTTMKCTGSFDHRLRAFSDFYECRDKYISGELTGFKSTIEGFRHQMPQSLLPSLNKLSALLSVLSGQVDCLNTSRAARAIEQLVCQDQFKYIAIYVIANCILCLTLPISVILLKSLSHCRRLSRQNDVPASNSSRPMPMISTLTVNRIRKALRRGSRHDEGPSAPPMVPMGKQRRPRRTQRLYPDVGLKERKPMLPRRQYSPNDVSPPPYQQ